MHLLLCETYEELSQQAAQIVARQITQKPSSVLGLATGSTPLGTYQILSKMNQKGEVDFTSVKTFNLDEYYPIREDDPQSYHTFMNNHFFSKINIKKENTHLLDGFAQNPEAECENFEARILQSGGIDLQILGIGHNGHIGFNEPGDALSAKTHRTTLSESTRAANARFFDHLDQVPKQALTMGMGTILKAKKIILLANGTNKQTIVQSLFNDELCTNNPASFLKLHRNTVIICDKSACSSNIITKSTEGNLCYEGF